MSKSAKRHTAVYGCNALSNTGTDVKIIVTREIIIIMQYKMVVLPPQSIIEMRTFPVATGSQLLLTFPFWYHTLAVKFFSCPQMSYSFHRLFL